VAFLRKIFIGSLSFYYALIGLEIAIMISPFAAYFYSVYAPVLNLLYSYSLTRWLADFFLPHMVFTDNLFLKIFGISSPFLFYPGIAIFLIGFVQIYGAKLLRKGVVKGALYSKSKTPAVSGIRPCRTRFDPLLAKIYDSGNLCHNGGALLLPCKSGRK